ncbi:TPA: hypothetical protein JD344_18590 [Serratia marcescens]|nr:hypothetical protein FR965_07415 [Serratia marcescens]CAE7326796.1 hypothetical protein AI2617V1_3449 [Serratia marcescens]CAH4002137.1 hypothetical protein AI2617V1_3449 [Serratia marcescens]HAU5720583.1 hypothetical protein [Serratia marcescens]HAU5740702.1 hypothetical protein [Serratia marcescens]
MGSLTTTYRRSQLRSLPVPGGKEPVDYCYVVRIPNGWEETNHGHLDWAVGDFRQQQQETRHD